MFCTNCGSQQDEGAKFCGSCGSALGANTAAPVAAPAPATEAPAAQPAPAPAVAPAPAYVPSASTETSPNNWLVALLLCFFLGYLGIHRFYVGKIGSGIGMILTFGGFGIWVLIDFIMICTSSFRDMQGRALRP